MLRVNRERNSLRNYGTTSAGHHDCDEHITRSDGKSFQRDIFLLGNEARLRPYEAVLNGVIDPKNGHALAHEFGMK